MLEQKRQAKETLLRLQQQANVADSDYEDDQGDDSSSDLDLLVNTTTKWQSVQDEFTEGTKQLQGVDSDQESDEDLAEAAKLYRVEEKLGPALSTRGANLANQALRSLRLGLCLNLRMRKNC